MTASFGAIEDIYRYPVKSFAGERLNDCAVERYGLHGDRLYAFYDETKEGWSRYVTARKIPGMLGYQASWNATNELIVKTPDGRQASWDEALLHELQAHTSINLSMLDYRSLPPEPPALMAVDAASILLITTHTVRKLEKLWGKPVDAQRFRANLVLRLDDERIDESIWIGKRLRIGDVELQVDEPCERCAMITIDPETIERDASLLKTVHKEMDLKFGVYASVVKPGHIQSGDRVYLQH